MNPRRATDSFLVQTLRDMFPASLVLLAVVLAFIVVQLLR